MGNSQGKPVIYTDEVNLNHFRLLRVVGKGAFGKVRIVERKDSGLTFALKYIRKDEGQSQREKVAPKANVDQWFALKVFVTSSGSDACSSI